LDSFFAFEVWDNILDEEVTELEGLLRHIYRYDPEANKLNIQKGLKKARRVRDQQSQAMAHIATEEIKRF
jgi:hypothetical protein